MRMLKYYKFLFVLSYLTFFNLNKVLHNGYSFLQMKNYAIQILPCFQFLEICNASNKCPGAYLIFEDPRWELIRGHVYLSSLYSSISWMTHLPQIYLYKIQISARFWRLGTFL